MPPVRIHPGLAAAGLALVACGGVVVAQIEGSDRGVTPIASDRDFEVSGVHVDVSGKTADEARYAGWRLAQRQAWKTLSTRLGSGGAGVADSTLDGMVSAIAVENEQIGPTRYIADLGVLFDRVRAGSLLGVSAAATRSAPMLIIPLQWSGGVGQVYETRTPWQEAWARFRTGNSAIDYIRPAGTGPDSLLLNAGQVSRRGRGWWRSVIFQYGASDVLIPTVRLYRQWPGGPVVGVFQARHGPDNEYLDGFTLRVASEEGLPKLLDEGVRRLDAIFSRAITGGYLRGDPGLSTTPPGLPAPTPTDDASAGEDEQTSETAAAATSTVNVQFDTPTAAAVNAGEAQLRAVPGVRSAATTSLALGGISIMRVTFDGDPDALKAALEARGFQVFGSGTTIRVRRAPQLLPPDLAKDDRATG